jgi:putative hemolysin
MELFVLVSLILFNGVFAMAELAILTAKRLRLETAAEQGNVGAAHALRLADNPNRFLSTVQVGITSIGVLSGIVGEAALAQPLEIWLHSFGIDATLSNYISTALVVVVVTYFSIVIGELIPKRIAQTYPESVAILISRPIMWLSSATRPFVFLLSRSTELFLQVLSIRDKRESDVTEEEIYAVLKEGAESGVLESEERVMMQNIFRLDERKLASLMIPVADVIHLDLAADLSSNLRLISSSNHSRYPVIYNDWNNVVGILRTKLLVQGMVEGTAGSIETLLDEALFVPVSTSALSLFTQLQRTDSKMALVVDEYGAVLGLVTIQNLLEAITGQFDPGGQKLEWATQRQDGSWLIDGAIPVLELKDLLAIRALPEEDRNRYSSISGMFLLLHGAIPKEGDFVVWAGWRFEVVDMDGNAIDKVLATRMGAS